MNINISTIQSRTLVVILFLILFGGNNLLDNIGVDIKLYRSIVIAFATPFVLINRKEVLANKSLSIIILFILIFSMFKLMIDTGQGTRTAVLQLLGAPILYAAFPKINYGLASNRIFLWRKFAILFFGIYLLDSNMAIIERIMEYNILGWVGYQNISISKLASSQFRSTALLGHPLYNSLVISIVMSFILIIPLKPKYKLSLWLIGYFAVLSFNTRGSIVGNALLLGVYMIYSILCDKTLSLKYKRSLTMLSVLASIMIVVTIFTTKIGGRLLDEGLMDSSAQVRVDVWNVFDYFDLSEFLWGITYKKLQIILSASGLHATENFWLDQLFSFGLIFMVFYVLLYARIFMVLLRNYTKFQAFFVTGSFLLIASTNNSLSTDFLALFIFLMLTHLFDPKYIKYLVRPKYLVNRKASTQIRAQK